MRLRNLDLIGAMCFVLAAMGWVLLPSRPLLVGVLLAIPLVFVLPGYTLALLLLRRQAADQRPGLILQPGVKAGRPFSVVDLMAFSLGLSLVIDVVTGFLLNLLPVGLQWQSWTLALGFVTEVFTLLAALARRGQRGHQSQPVKQQDITARRLPLKASALLASALAITALAFWLALSRPPQPPPMFTQFWMLPASAGASCAVQIGLHSLEARSQSYRIEVTSNGTQVAFWPSITLASQQEWNQQLPISLAGSTNGGAVIDARLYREDQPGVIYREVHVTLRGGCAP